jgi:hypothetical protein
MFNIFKGILINKHEFVVDIFEEEIILDFKFKYFINLVIAKLVLKK